MLNIYNKIYSFLVYNLAKMKLETVAKGIEDKDKLTSRYNYDTFSVGSSLDIFYILWISRS
jgi:hypothetical protein